MKYKVGDKVRIKSIDWYNENKDNIGQIDVGYAIFGPEMTEYCGRVVTISRVNKHYYDIIDDDEHWCWTDEMIEGLVEKKISIKLTGEAIKNNEMVVSVDEYILPEGYIFKDENGNVINATKIVLERKKPKYPTSYEECCKVLGIDVCDLDILNNMLDTSEMVYRKNLDRLLNAFRKLIICRDAYWKLYGDEMGLDGLWEHDWDAKDNHFYTIHTFNGKIECSATAHRNAVLIFPTEEMRDAFYENFKKLIEFCKEFL